MPEMEHLFLQHLYLFQILLLGHAQLLESHLLLIQGILDVLLLILYQLKEPVHLFEIRLQLIGLLQLFDQEVDDEIDIAVHEGGFELGELDAVVL